MKVMERRASVRYPLDLKANYHLMRRDEVVASGEGQTVNISSGGILLRPDNRLLDNEEITVSIAWPATLNGGARLQLCLTGRVVRADDTHAAVRCLGYVFKTARSSMSM